jgi:hypothetical protein
LPENGHPQKNKRSKLHWKNGKRMDVKGWKKKDHWLTMHGQRYEQGWYQELFGLGNCTPHTNRRHLSRILMKYAEVWVHQP